MMTGLVRNGLAALTLASCALSAPAVACVAAPQAVSQEAGRIGEDEDGRAVAPILVDGQGPFRFIIDTGANRSVLSGELADQLGLARVGYGVVHSIEGAHEAPMVDVGALSFGDTTLAQGRTPVIDGPVLAGERGVLGVDGMLGRLLYVDFANRCVEIFSADHELDMQGWTTVEGRFRFGTLFVAKGSIQGVRINVLVDTGATISLGNTRLRDALKRVRASVIEYHGDFAQTFGRPVVLEDSVWAPRIQFGDGWISRVTAYIGDFHIFDLWGLEDEPTLLIGMDVLQNARAMAIDYERGVVYFRANPRGTGW
jgi:predicted aspartyl protease